MTTRGAEYIEAETEEQGARARSCVEPQVHWPSRVAGPSYEPILNRVLPRCMGSAVPCREAQLHCAERVYRDVHPGLALSRTVQRNVPAAFAASCKEN